MNKKFLFNLLGFVLLTVLLGACKIVDVSTLPKAIPVQMGSGNFTRQEVIIHEGDSINLVSQSSSEHVIANGVWENGQAKPMTEPNAPIKEDVTIPGNGSLVVGPFTTMGDYHLYCPIHPGMNLIVHVK
jgi:plastocyanin